MERRNQLIGLAVGVAATAAARAAVDRARRRVEADAVHLRRSAARVVTTPDGVALHVEVEEPDGPGADGLATVVLVHGFAMSQDCWHYQRAHLRGRRRLVLLDHRSHGRSSLSDPEHLTLDRLGRDLAQVIDEVVGEGPVVLVGHSMGGMTIMSLAEQRPELFGERVVGVALIATSAGGMATESVIAPFVPDRMAERVKPPITRVLRRLAPAVDVSRKRLPNAMFVGARLVGLGRDASPEKVGLVARDLSVVPALVVIEMAPTFDDHDRYEALAAFSGVPTLIVTGSRDLVVRPRHSRDLHERIPGSRLVALDGPGHCVMIERDVEVNALLDELIDLAEAGARR